MMQISSFIRKSRAKVTFSSTVDKFKIKSSKAKVIDYIHILGIELELACSRGLCREYY